MKMGFKEQYTTAELVSKEVNYLALLGESEVIPKDVVYEQNKIVLSNDAFAIGQMLECLINKLVK